MGAQGTTTVNFGAFPGASDTSVVVTGQGSILSGSLVEAWIFPTATADHSADEHWVECIQVMAGNVVASTGFTIYARNATPEQTAQTMSGTFSPQPTNGTRLYGQWTVAWCWN